MLPTLNLQLSPVELPDETASTPISALTGVDGEAETGFADVLRRRVGGPLMAEDTGGELLPQGGSALPLLTDFAPTELTQEMLQSADIPGGSTESPLELGPSAAVAGDSEFPELRLQTPVPYLPPDGVTAPTAQTMTASTPLAVAPLVAPLSQTSMVPTMTGESRAAGSILPTVQPRGLETAIIPEGRQTAPIPPSLSNLPATGREASPLALAEATAVMPPTTVDPRVLGQLRQGEPKTLPVTLTKAIADGPEHLRPADPAGRLDLSGAPRVDVALGTTADALQPRLPVQQAMQNTQPQLNLPLPQSPLIPPAHSTPTPLDMTYAGVTQSGTELISTSVRDSAWGNQLGERVLMMASNQLKSAEIRLTPAELGPLRVQIAVDDGAANVTFHAQHAITRDAIEQALPRLREMLAENGLSLGQADVSDRGVGDGDRDAGRDDSSSSLTAETSEGLSPDADHETRGRTITSNGLVDTFA